jgi:hypothetical protein
MSQGFTDHQQQTQGEFDDMRKVRERAKVAVKFFVITIAGCRTEEVGKPRTPPRGVENNPDKSQAVRSEVEAVRQQWADDDQ